MSEIGDLNGAVARLLGAAADAYAATGQAEAIAAAASLRACPPPRVPVQAHKPAALEDLEAALALLAPGPLADVLRDCAARLPWTESSLPMPDNIIGRYTYMEIAGPEGFSVTDTLGFGLYLQMRETFYPAHSHAAEELYYVLSGSATWQKGDGAFETQAPGSYIHHLPQQRHAMETAREPLLAMWLWTGDLDETSYRIDGA